MDLTTWAKKWGVPLDALNDLRAQLHECHPAEGPPARVIPGSEGAVSNALRVMASERGDRLWRNNIGVAKTETGVVRFGLANDSTRVNRQFKSSDLIGIRRVKITPDHVGDVIGQFAAIECKKPGWVFAGTDREKAQLRFINFVISMGGFAKFTDREDLS